MKYSLLVLLGLLAFSKAQAQEWQVQLDQSSMTMNFPLYDEPLAAGFSNFDAEIVFDKDDLSGAFVRATIDLSSFYADDSLAETEAAGADWFFTAEFPEAIFEATQFAKLSDGTFEAMGTLQIRNVITDISFQFDLEINGSQATMAADISLNRIDLGLGLNTWADRDRIPHELTLNLRITAEISP